MPTVSVIIPIYNIERFISIAIASVLNQSFSDYELLLINDGSTDHSLEICHSFTDPRIRLISQTNRGLAGARNTGIRHAKGRYIAFLDGDDCWDSEKLTNHVAHLDQNPEVGVSYSQSKFMDDNGVFLGITQRPKLESITPVDILCRNPIGNGSAPVIRRTVFEQICYEDNQYGDNETFYFDDTFRQSEDIECWLRIANTTDWKFEGLALPLTWYRANSSGLSANLKAQYESWNRAINKTRTYAPELLDRWENRARAYQLRYLARRAIRSRDAKLSSKMITQSIRTDPGILLQEPARTLITLCCAGLLLLLPTQIYHRLENFAMTLVSRMPKAGSNPVEALNHE